MKNGLGQQQRGVLSTGLKVDPRVVLSSQLLELPRFDLESAIQTELEENPALERLGGETEPISDEAILRTVAPNQLRPDRDDHEHRRSLPQGGDDEVDWIDFAQSRPDLVDHLLAQLLPRLAPDQRRVGEYLIGCLDERGYLVTPVEEVALECDVSIEAVEAVLRELQRCDPPGIGARTVSECLIAQLRDDDAFEAKLARAILIRHFDLFVARDERALMRKLGVVADMLREAIERILSLNPFPAEEFGVGPGSRTVSAVVQPDLVFRLSESGWRIETPGLGANDLAISRSYTERKSELEQMRRPPSDEKRHIGEMVERAQRFIGALEQRRRTLVAIGEYLIAAQPGFLQTGEGRFLAPMTRSQIAQATGLHESTVSRATAEKFVQLANGEVVAFETFFNSSLRIQKMIEEILSHEDPNRPLSDERIAQMLAERGVKVARRTVNKYRDKNKLLSSRNRRRSA
jgi:RNA polymerase sigma-54 factor